MIFLSYVVIVFMNSYSRGEFALILFIKLLPLSFRIRVVFIFWLSCVIVEANGPGPVERVRKGEGIVSGKGNVLVYFFFFLMMNL